MKTMMLQVALGLFLVSLSELGGQAKVVPPSAVNHVFVVDCSGSMSGELPAIREQIKKRLPKLLGPEDTFSVVWFSGRGEFGVLLEGERLASLTDYQDVNRAIDKLRPVGLTGFREPLLEVQKVAARLTAKNKAPLALVFLSDGCDNQSSPSEVLKAVEAAASVVSSATVVEYGYYADRAMLTRMAEKLGGSVLFAQGFDSYAPQFEAAIQRKGVNGGKRVEVALVGDVVGGFAYALGDGEILTFAVEDGQVSVPEGVKELHYLAANVGPGLKAKEPLYVESNPPPEGKKAALYAAVNLYAGRMKPEVVLPLLKYLGDVALVEEFGGCFGKQRYSAFQDNVKAAVFDTSKRLTAGYNPDAVPPDDAFTVLDVLSLLAEDDGNRVLLDSTDFEYQRIGRAQVDAQTFLTAEEQAEVDRLTDEMVKAGRDGKKVAALSAQIAALSDKKAMRFVPDVVTDGYPITSLVYNEERPNVSIQVRKTGKVKLEGVPADLKLPESLDTFVYRAYTVIRDGIVNIKRLPVRVSMATAEKLGKLLPPAARPTKMTMGPGYVEGTINLDKLPVVNRQMIKGVSAVTLFNLEWDLTKARARQKVLKAVLDEKAPGGKKSAGFEAQYGADAAAWLKSVGITDYSGFSPKSVQAESTDFYMSREVAVSLKGFSSLPTVVKAREAKSKGKATPSTAIMFAALDEVEAQAAKGDDAALTAWLRAESEAATRWVRDLLRLKAAQVFSIVVGQVWPSEFASLAESQLTIRTAEGIDLECKIEQVEKKITI